MFDYHHVMKMAERQGFEPWEVLPSTVFKTAAIDHSAISPQIKIENPNASKFATKCSKMRSPCIPLLDD